jgi:hypothetical protein
MNMTEINQLEVRWKINDVRQWLEIRTFSFKESVQSQSNIISHSIYILQYNLLQFSFRIRKLHFSFRIRKLHILFRIRHECLLKFRD